MSKAIKLHGLRNQLKGEINSTFRKLREKHQPFNFVDEKVWDDAVINKRWADMAGLTDHLTPLDMITNNGETVEVKVLSITKDGIYVSETQDPNQCKWIGYRDIYDLYYMIELIDQMEEAIKKV